MANLLNGDIWKLTYIVQAGDQVAEPGVHFRAFNCDGLKADTDVLFALEAAHNGALKACLSSVATYRGMKFQRVWPKPVSFPIYSNNGFGVGTGAAKLLPRQVSGIISFKTNFGGPRFRGRIFIPFPSEDDSGDLTGQPNVGYQANLTTLAGIITAGYSEVGVPATAELKVVVFDRKTGGFTDVNGFIVRPRWATQRKRGDYGQQNVPPV